MLTSWPSGLFWAQQVEAVQAHWRRQERMRQLADSILASALSADSRSR